MEDDLTPEPEVSNITEKVLDKTPKAENEKPSLLIELLLAHKKKLEESPDSGSDYFSFPEDPKLHQIYEQLTIPQITELVNFLVQGGISEEIEEKFGSRAIGNLLHTLTRTRQKDVEESLKKILSVLPKENLDEKTAENVLIIQESGENFDFGDKSNYLSFIDESKTSEDQIRENVALINFRRGILTQDIDDIIEMKVFTGTASQKDLPPLKAYLEKLINEQTEETKSKQFPLAAGIIGIQIANRDQELDKQALGVVSSSEIPQSFDLVAIISSTGVPREKLTPQVVGLLSHEPLSPELIQVCISAAIEQQTPIDPNSLFAELLQKQAKDTERIGELIKSGLDKNKGDWEKVDPLIRRALQEAASSGLEAGTLDGIASSCMAYGVDIPNFLQTILKDRPDLLADFGFIFSSQSSTWKREWYPQSPKIAFFRNGLNALPEGIRKPFSRLLEAQEGSFNFNKSARRLVMQMLGYDSSGTDSYFSEYYISGQNPPQEISALVHPDIWRIISQANENTLKEVFQEIQKKATIKIEYFEGEAIQTQSFTPAELMPDTFKQQLRDKLFKNHTIPTDDAISFVESFSILLTSDFLSAFPPQDRLIIKLINSARNENGGYNISKDLLNLVGANRDKYITVVSGKPLLNSQFFRDLLDFHTGSNPYAKISENSAVILRALSEEGLCDLSDQSSFTPEENQFFTLLLSEKTGAFAESFIEKIPKTEQNPEQPTLKIDMTGCLQLLDITSETIDGKPRWKYSFKPDRLVEYIDKLKGYDISYKLDVFKTSGLIDYNILTSWLLEEDTDQTHVSRILKTLGGYDSEESLKIILALAAKEGLPEEARSNLEQALRRNKDNFVPDHVIEYLVKYNFDKKTRIIHKENMNATRRKILTGFPEALISPELSDLLLYNLAPMIKGLTEISPHSIAIVILTSWHEPETKLKYLGEVAKVSGLNEDFFIPALEQTLNLEQGEFSSILAKIENPEEQKMALAFLLASLKDVTEENREVFLKTLRQNPEIITAGAGDTAFILRNIGKIELLGSSRVQLLIKAIKQLQAFKDSGDIHYIKWDVLNELLKENPLLNIINDKAGDSTILPALIGLHSGYNQKEIIRLISIFSQEKYSDPDAQLPILGFLAFAKNSGIPREKLKMILPLIQNAPELLAQQPLRQFVLDSLPKLSSLPPDKLNKLTLLSDQINLPKLTILFMYRTELLKGALSSEKFLSSEVNKDNTAAFLPNLVGSFLMLDEKDTETITRVFQSLHETSPETAMHQLEYMLRSAKLPAEERKSAVRVMELAPLLTSNPGMHNLILNNVSTLSKLSEQEIAKYIEIFSMIDNSPSQEIQKLRQQLLEQLFKTANPVETYRLIENIFITNNLPTAGKIFRMFELLNPPDSIESSLKSHPKASPVLQNSGYRRGAYNRRFDIIYRDLLKVHLLSGNITLKDFLSTIQGGSDLLQAAEINPEELGTEEKKQLYYFFQKLDTLFTLSVLGRERDILPSGPVNPEAASSLILSKLNNLKISLGVKPSQTIAQRVSEMFLRPLQIPDIESALQMISDEKKAADTRNRRIVKETEKGFLRLKIGDLLKGTQSAYFELQMQNGIVAQEYLGASSGRDSTPFDTDVAEILPDQEGKDFASILQGSPVKSYGNLVLVFRNNGQFQPTSAAEKAEYDGTRYELFSTEVVGPMHKGVRTGLPSTEINFIAIQNTITQTELENVFYTIAQNGFYIPVVSSSGEIIFTPEMYEQYRRTFDGIDRFGGDQFEYVPTNPDQTHFKELDEIRTLAREESKQTMETLARVRSIVKEALAEFNVKLNDQYERGSLNGAELLDTGSSGRNTNAPGDLDFDLALILDAKNFQDKKDAIIARIKEKLAATKQDEDVQDISHTSTGENYQIRIKGVPGLADKPIDIDIAVSKKSELHEFASHEAVAAKLNWIKKHYGEDAYWDVIANILFAKKVLKAHGAYKKVEHGGLGGIGVENWILANKGNLQEAMRTFLRAAHRNGQRLPFVEFRENYKIFDPGTNIRGLHHENFIDKLSGSVSGIDGYNAMVDAILASGILNEAEITEITKMLK